MKIHQAELQHAQMHGPTAYFEGLTPLQARNLRERGRTLYRWFTAHRRSHNVINLTVIAFLLLAQLAVLLGSLHGWLL